MTTWTCADCDAGATDLGWAAADRAAEKHTKTTSHSTDEREALVECSELVGDDIGYWLNNPFLPRALLAAKVAFWMQAATDRAKAEAWDEGFSAGLHADIGSETQPPNPYRAGRDS